MRRKSFTRTRSASTARRIALLDAVKKTDERLWYAQQSIANGWSRNVLVLQIESELYRRQGKALTNFAGIS